MDTANLFTYRLLLVNITSLKMFVFNVLRQKTSDAKIVLSSVIHR